MPRATELSDLVKSARQADGGGGAWFAELIENGRLTPKGLKVAHFVATNPRFTSFSSASDLADRLEVNVATVVRFAQNLGFSGWTEFQLHFRHRYLGSLLPSGVMRDQATEDGRSPVEAAIHRDIENLEATLRSLDFSQARSVAELIAGAPRTLVVSSGSYAAVGQVLAHQASFMGFDVRLETRGGPHIVAALSRFEPGDCVIAISFWRLVKHVMLTAEYARAHGLTTVAVTDSLFSPLARAADHALIVPTESVAYFQSMTAALSVVYGLLAELHALGGSRVEETIVRQEKAYADLDVLVA